MRLPNLSGLRAFEAAARHQSFKLAADELNITPTAISHRIRRLEQDLDTRLFHRQTRAIALTRDGEVLLPDVRQAFERLAEATQKLGRLEDDKVLTISVVTSFAVKWLLPHMPEFQAMYPDIDVRISTGMGLSTFGSDGVDMAIRYGLGQWPGTRADLLLREDSIPVASPNLLIHGNPLQDATDLSEVVLLHVSAYPDDWQRWLTMAGLPDLKPKGHLSFDESIAAQQAAIDGLGVALGRPAIIASDLKAGRLITPFSLSLHQDTAFYVVSPQATENRPNIKAFRDWILSAVGD